MNIKKWINTINGKVLITFIGFAIGILLFYWVIQTLFINLFYENYQYNAMNRINDLIYKVDDEGLDELLDEFLYDNNICIQVYYNDELLNERNINTVGCILARPGTDSYKDKLESTDQNIAMLELINTDNGSKSLMSRIDRDETVLYLFTTLEDIDAVSIALENQLIYLIFLSIGLAIIVAYLLSKWITKPILSVIDGADDLMHGKYKVMFKKCGVTELDDLSNSLNCLSRELDKTEEFRRDLMANVSHDLKTPLTMIKAYSEMVRDMSYKDKDKREEHLNIIMKETDRLNILVNDILELSKLQANTTVLNYEKFDLDQEIKSILKSYEILTDTEGYKVNYEGVEDAFIYADKNKINQVIYNLINNAINYTGEDKVVTIKIVESKNTYRVNVIDTGKGIDSEDINYIWDKYYKKEKNHRRNVIGTGLGLSIVKNILLSHGCKFGVDSVKKKGSTFYFEIEKSVNK